MKERMDQLLVNRGFFDSRERAKANIMAGRVLANGRRVDKAGEKVDENAEIQVKADAIPFVSRGGLKLQKAMTLFPIDLGKKTCMDIGASTGGFTDCMLQQGASKVYAVDVGYGQLDYRLRMDPRVTVMERTNIRHVEAGHLPEKVAFFSIDVSFISLKLVLPKLKELGSEEFSCVALIKPQFEVGKKDVGKNGVVREKEKHKKAIIDCLNYCQENHLTAYGLTYSPVKGPKGNIEFLLYLGNKEENGKIDVGKTVEEAHQSLDRPGESVGIEEKRMEPLRQDQREDLLRQDQGEDLLKQDQREERRMDLLRHKEEQNIPSGRKPC